MDLSCIISSGDLELYLLGMLPEEESNKIEQLALLFPEVKQELDRISGTLQDFARASERTPAAGVKADLMTRLRNLKSDEPETGTLITPFPADVADNASNNSFFCPCFSKTDEKI